MSKFVNLKVATRVAKFKVVSIVFIAATFTFLLKRIAFMGELSSQLVVELDVNHTESIKICRLLLLLPPTMKVAWKLMVPYKTS